MIPSNTEHLFRYTPSWMVSIDPMPVFLLRGATLNERAMFEAEIQAAPYLAGQVWPFEVVRAYREAAKAWLSGDDLATMNAAIDLYESNSIEPDDIETTTMLQTLFDNAATHWPATIALSQRAARRETVIPLLACKMFLAGWENCDTEFKSNFGKISDSSLSELSDIERRFVGEEAYKLMMMSDEDKKKYKSPSKSSTDPLTSTSESTLPEAAPAGPSVKPATRKTRSSTKK